MKVNVVDRCKTDATLTVPFILKENWGSNTIVNPNVNYKVYVGLSLPQVLIFEQGVITVDSLYSSYTTCN